MHLVCKNSENISMVWEGGGVKIEDITYAMAQLSGKHDVVCREFMAVKRMQIFCQVGLH